MRYVYAYNVVLVISLLCAVGCTAVKQIELLDNAAFEKVIDGKEVGLYTLKNKNGLVTQITNYGGRVVSLWVPDQEGNFADVVLGYESIDGYLSSNELYFGALVGRYGNRIANGRFSLSGQVYTLAQNNNNHHLHGGVKGYNNVVWTAEQLDQSSLKLSYLSVHMEEGYPGNLSIEVIYTLSDDNELRIEYTGETDEATHVNLTHHSFFNLQGAGKGSINNHELFINADYYTPIDSSIIPTGEIAPVEGTPLDFTRQTAIGDRLSDDFDQLRFASGYDHNWVLNKDTAAVGLAARIVDPVSGRSMEVYTNEPGIQFYGCNFLNGSDKGKDGLTYEYRSAFCLETQHYPNTPNQTNFPSTVLLPNEQYHSVCVYKF